MTITYNIQISKARVLDEVQKTSAYIGSKAMSAQDPGAYERVAAVDANREQLDRFWMEACDDLSLLLSHWIVSVTSQMLAHHPEIGAANDYKVTLAMPTNWNDAYLSPLKEALMSYLVNSIVTKWLLITKKEDAESYAALASGTALQISQMLLERKRPSKRSPSNAGHSDLWGESSTLWGESGYWVS